MVANILGGAAIVLVLAIAIAVMVAVLEAVFRGKSE